MYASSLPQSESAKPRVRVVLQSRVASSRLPAKAMLTINGFPLVTLAALRAAMSDYELVVATSISRADDAIFSACNFKKINVMRGPEDDVLSRFLQASSDLADSDVLVRLTADNVLPDGNFIRSAVNSFLNSDLLYMSTVWPNDGLPYGLSCEVFLVRTIRVANEAQLSAADREHVTPWVRRTYGVTPFPNSKRTPSWSHLRVTVDTIDDYIRMERAFRDVEDPVSESWEAIANKLELSGTEPRFLVPSIMIGGRRQSKMVLGSAQIGFDYGISNIRGQPSIDESIEIVRHAASHGLSDVDTARAYGQSEQRIGHALAGGRGNDMRVITKLDPLLCLDDDAAGDAIDHAVDASIFRSCRELGLRTLPVVLLHRAQHLVSYGGQIWKRLLYLRSEGVVDSVGVSVQSVDEARMALQIAGVSHIQLPCNLLDWRWQEAGIDAELLGRPDITVHARSAFLQGLLVQESDELWPKLEQLSAPSVLNRLRSLVAELDRDGLDDLAIAYLQGQAWIHGVVVGVESMSQLKRNLSLFARKALTASECRYVRAMLPRVPERLLNPSQWPAS